MAVPPDREELAMRTHLKAASESQMVVLVLGWASCSSQVRWTRHGTATGCANEIASASANANVSDLEPIPLGRIL